MKLHEEFKEYESLWEATNEDEYYSDSDEVKNYIDTLDTEENKERHVSPSRILAKHKKMLYDLLAQELYWEDELAKMDIDAEITNICLKYLAALDSKIDGGI
jgi:hypothetical protein